MTVVRMPKKETSREFFDDLYAGTGGPPTPTELQAARKRIGLGGTARSSSHMSVKTAYEKIAISLPSRAAEHVRRAVRSGLAKSASAYIADAIEERAKTETLEQMLDRMLEESGGPMTTAEARWADRQLGVKPRRSRAKKRKKA